MEGRGDSIRLGRGGGCEKRSQDKASSMGLGLSNRKDEVAVYLGGKNWRTGWRRGGRVSGLGLLHVRRRVGIRIDKSGAEGRGWR